MKTTKKKSKLPGFLLGVVETGRLEHRVMRLLEERLPWARRGRIIAAAVCVVVLGAASVGVGIFGVRASQAQSGKLPVYEIVSIKQNKSAGEEWSLSPTPDGFRATATLRMLIRDAFGFIQFTDDKILGAPDWVKSEKYDVAAKVDSADATGMEKLSQDQRGLMLQALLADRFKLKIHTETRESPAYALVVAKNGSKLQEAKPNDSYPNGIKMPDGTSRAGLMAMGNGRLIGQAIPLATFSNMLSHQPDIQGRSVVDRTGLAGKYDVTLHWTPTSDKHESTDSVDPAIFTAIQEQLGLRLEPIKAPVGVLVIDHVERPTEN